MPSAIHDLTVTGRLRVTTERGELVFDGNELIVRSTIDDPPAVRLGYARGGGKIGFDVVRPDGVHEEVLMILGSEQEDRPGSYGGQVKFFSRAAGEDGDGAMRLRGVLSAAYAGDATWRWYPTLGPFAEPGRTGPPPEETRTVAHDNLARAGEWWRAINRNLDTRLTVELYVEYGRRVSVALGRTHDYGTAPYVYVRVDGESVYAGQIAPVDRITLPAARASGRMRLEILSAAQTGTVEIGPIEVGT